jgi:hypothetical protein
MIERYFNKTYVVLPIFIFIAFIFCTPLLKNLDFLGVEDWDEYFFRNALARTTIINYKQVPLWNPYSCGGNVFLAHPTSSFLSPFFLFVLLFGEVIGLKITIVVYLITGLYGVFLLSRYFGIKFPACFLASFVYMLGAIYPMHVAAGLVGEFTMALVPYAFLFYLKGIKEKKYLWLSALFISLMIFGGSLRVVTIFSFFLIIFSILMTIMERKINYIKALIFVLIFAFLFSGIKCIPMLEFLKDHRYIRYDSGGIGFKMLAAMLFKRICTYDPEGGIFASFPYDWYHCGAYIGIIPFLLFFVGSIIYWPSRWPLILTGIVFAFFSTGKTIFHNLKDFIYSLPFFSSILSALHTPPRFILGFVFVVSIISSLGLSTLEKYPKGRLFKFFSFALVFFVLYDLIATNSVLLKKVFILAPQKTSAGRIFQQGLSELDYLKEDSDIYRRFLENKGTVNAQEIDNIYPVGAKVLPFTSTQYKQEVYLLQNNGKLSLQYFSPNKIVVVTDLSSDDRIVLNQNYYKGWKVKKDKKTYPAQNLDGLISTSVGAGNRVIEFFYLPNSFIFGSILSSLTVLAGCLLFIKNRQVLI